jgi:phage/conjugal plasmid C-4 type zinc finger TraR family protein
MELGERAIESSGAFADAERDREIERTQAKLAQEGDAFCQGCGEEIPAARRAALPSATRCIECQAKLERRPR